MEYMKIISLTHSSAIGMMGGIVIRYSLVVIRITNNE